MKVFAAGGTGVIGLPSVKALVAAGHQVCVNARTDKKARLVRELGAEPIRIDVFEVTALREAMRGCDAAIRLTTKIPPLARSRKLAAWEENNRLRTVGAQRMVDAALDANVGIYLNESVTFVYADGGEQSIDESAAVDEGGLPVFHAVLAGENETRRFERAGGRGIVLRFAGFYAPYASTTRDTVALVRRLMLPQFGDGRHYFASIHVDDAASAVAAALAAPSGTYNICDDEPVPWCQFLQVLSHAAGAPAPFRIPAFLGPLLLGFAWKYLSRSHRVSNRRFKSVTGWAPQIRSVVEGWPLVIRALS
jgi:nucleoside-diphosphate-sugar epimerase